MNVYDFPHRAKGQTTPYSVYKVTTTGALANGDPPITTLPNSFSRASGVGGRSSAKSDARADILRPGLGNAIASIGYAGSHIVKSLA